MTSHLRLVYDRGEPVFPVYEPETVADGFVAQPILDAPAPTPLFPGRHELVETEIAAF